jgi:hypothetical protein
LFFRYLFWIPLYFYGGLGEISWPAWMCLLAGFAIGTESCKIEFTEDLADVLLRAVWPERTETLFVVRARGEFRGRVDVKVQAFI